MARPCYQERPESVMSRYNSIKRIVIFLILILALSNCKSPMNGAQKPATTKPNATAKNSPIDEDSLPIDDKEARELSEPEARPNPESEQELAFLRHFKIGQSLDDVRKNSPAEVKL